MKKISIICVVRNDDYGLHQVDRTIAFLKSLNEIPNKDIYEIVFVEWNPIIDELSFYDRYINYLPKSIDIKFVIVSKETHESIENLNNLPVFEYYGKNVGARHSSGEFLIFTNPDNVFFPQTWIDVESNISDKYFLRLCRSDVRFTDTKIIYNTTGNETVKQLMDSHFHFYYVPDSTTLTDAKSYEELSEGFIWDTNHEGASGDFFGISRENYYKIKGYREFWTYGGFDSIICKDAKSIGLKQFILPKYSVHIDHTRPHQYEKQGTDIKLELEYINNENWGLNNRSGISVTDYHIKN
jgi:hypothetical protein